MIKVQSTQKWSPTSTMSYYGLICFPSCDTWCPVTCYTVPCHTMDSYVFQAVTHGAQ